MLDRGNSIDFRFEILNVFHLAFVLANQFAVQLGLLLKILRNTPKESSLPVEETLP